MYGKRVILVDPVPSSSKLYSLNFQVYLGAEVIQLANADKVQEFLKNDKEIDLIVMVDMVHDENTSLKIFYYVNSNKLKTKMLLLGENFKIKKEVEQVDKSKWKEVIKRSAKLMGITAEQMVEMEVPDHYPFDVGHFVPVIETPVDVYEKTKDGFQVLFKAEEKIDQGYIKDLTFKKVPHLYVHREERLKFAASFSDQALNFLKDETLRIEERANLTARAFSDTVKRVTSIGMDEYAVELAKNSIESVNKMVTSSNKLSDLYTIIQNSTDSYLYKHSILTSLVGTRAIKELKWGKEDQYEKFCFISFFHDITIPEEHLCNIHNAQELSTRDLSPEDKKKVENHALNACELLKDYPGVPFGADTIILQHHGMLNGIGFTEKLNFKLSSMAMVFMIAEECADYLMDAEPSPSIVANITKILRQKFSKQKYLEIVNAIDAAFS